MAELTITFKDIDTDEQCMQLLNKRYELLISDSESLIFHAVTIIVDIIITDTKNIIL